ncbi:PREDICTED: U1 small nuclear ribonucleoprotein C-like isoform X1 [Branchiostoma belcheri]|uniref:U1 small nuclear ribonucleoprotein C n=1 Tax=Branchiostoma belcheri TaxID=7741 RepID=A0A6P4YPU9_BRABE|nr:PREDICTED: U1 small nuclear ribonucleoprotein C-like isoform X1 [Branchiostoma belcheri]
MPKYFCDYCDTYLTHDSPSVRKTHCNGRKHKENVRVYYQKWMEEQAQQLIDQTTAAFQAGKIPNNPFPNAAGQAAGNEPGAKVLPPAILQAAAFQAGKIASNPFPSSSAGPGPQGGGTMIPPPPSLQGPGGPGTAPAPPRMPGPLLMTPPPGAAAPGMAPPGAPIWLVHHKTGVAKPEALPQPARGPILLVPAGAVRPQMSVGAAVMGPRLLRPPMAMGMPGPGGPMGPMMGAPMMMGAMPPRPAGK